MREELSDKSDTGSGGEVMKHVIIGAGAAGISAARTIRMNRATDEIVVISADKAVHSRCMLHKFISGERNENELSFASSGFFEEYNIRWFGGVSVLGVDITQKRVEFDGGFESYDRLLIASGSESIFPPIEGLRKASNILGFRDLADAKLIREKAAKSEHIVILGAGLIGLDAAYGMVEMGKKPIIVEMAETVLSSNMDTHAAAAYQTKFEEAGCRFRLSEKVSKVLVDASGAATAVKLASGEQLVCDLLIVAAGCRPTTGYLANSGIAHEHGVTVDKHLETTAQGVYAAGDAAGLSSNWPDAVKQGEVAALNMCGLPAVYGDAPINKCTVNFFGIPSLSIGQFTQSQGDEVNSREDRRRYQKAIIRNGVPVGVILQGDISRGGFWQNLIVNKVNIAEIDKPTWKISLADKYEFDENGEYVAG